jgi:hypothetical protein
MYSIRNLLVALAIFGAVPLSLSAPTLDQNEAAAQYSPTPSLDDLAEPLVDADEVLNILEGRAVKCGITSAPRKNCQLSACKPTEHCKVSPKTNKCIWKKAGTKSRPSACLNCKCYVRQS